MVFEYTPRRKLAKCGKKLGRKRLMQYASIVTPHRILYWHRKLVALKYTAKRKVQMAQINCQMNGQVMAQIARSLTDAQDEVPQGLEYFVFDNDTLFANEFCETLEASGVKVIKPRVATPEQNG